MEDMETPGGEPSDELAALRRELVETIERKLEADRFREEQIDRLHGELLQLRAGLVERAMRPLFESLVRFHDDLARECRYASQAERGDEGSDRERLLSTLDCFRDDLLVLLERHGVEPVRGEGPTYDPRCQTAVGFLDSDDPDLVGSLAERRMPGFRLGETILRKERVVVYRVAEAGGEPAEAAGGDPMGGDE